MTERVKDARPASPVPGESAFKRAEGVSLALDALLERAVGAKNNPLGQTGAIANMMFIIAAISGMLLLVWYRPSVHLAYDSVQAMSASPYGAGLIRSLHRYSSDACVFFFTLHALRYFVARRFFGARWWAWVTGVMLVLLIWFVGWIGYGLVWDERAQAVALNSAKMLDLVPVFSEPMTRSLLTDDVVSSLLFFVIFFAHMTVPLLIGAGLLLHITRVSRAKFLTDRPMTIWLVVSLVVISVLVPATSAGPAAMLDVSPGYEMDWWYLMPLVFADRMTGMGMWLVVGFSYLGVTIIPWIFAPRAMPVRKAAVNLNACNGCTHCAQDCPFDAIIMIPREDGRRFDLQPVIDLDRCVGCGICAGSCDSGAIGLDWLPTQVTRRGLDKWIVNSLEQEEPTNVAFVCGSSGAAEFEITPEGTSPQLPGYRVTAVPCAGWVQSKTVERAFRKGAENIVIVGCNSSDPHYREGIKWTDDRLSGVREPFVREKVVDMEHVHFVKFNRNQPQAVIDELSRIASTGESSQVTPEPKGKRLIFAGIGVAAVFSALLMIPALVTYTPPQRDSAELVLSIKRMGTESDICRPVTEAENAARPLHMRRDEICERTREDVHIEVFVDDELVHEKTYRPRGLTRDGPAVAIETVAIDEGDRRIRIVVTGETFLDERMEFEHGQRRVIVIE